MQGLLNTEIWNGTTLGDVLTVDFIASILGNVLAAAAILLIGLWLARFVSRRIERLAEKNANLDRALFGFIGDLAWYAIFAFTVLFVLNTFGVRTTSVVAVIGAAGLAVGLALQGTLSNIAAGVMLIFFRPIRIGDFVVVNDVTGTVKDISLNYTELADLQNVQHIIPNSEVWGNTIQNYSSYDQRRVQWTFGVGYGANLAEAERVIRETITSDPRALKDPEPWLQVSNLNESSVDFMVRVWCNNADAWGFQTDMTRKVKEELDAAGVPIPFPTRTVVFDKSEDPLTIARPSQAAK
ncbi:mechanosensitive ion channel family protein [Pelagovum pacificum]|uniref:Small-conductance mechanosensitive channel n=1 Tax=Pelagovum pacificum TaxID=2588711 RepID=A0A5C5GJB0_9RHOB|nr:mechanosensitive ion channel family protein [Pelagovum pacificum]QQA42612.1 mechanosensitive ion channel family protein [Pelagovum pacificum]TNY34237.1 mechanosensitive ion channel family protein [Pelagovum pacificum]